MTCVAVMVVPLVVPRTRTRSPFVMALAEVELVPFWCFVEDVSSIVTFWPADVVSVKLDLDTLPTVPDDPPAAGPDRAFDPPPPERGPPAGPAPEASCPADAEVEVARPTDSPITGTMMAAATIRPPFVFHNNRRTLGRRPGVAAVTRADESSEPADGSGGAAPASPELPIVDGPDVALETGRVGRLSSGLGGS
jgi:hypothetical protein